MEKFGIFELLDALAALTATPPEEKDEPKALDPAYLPPDYAGSGTNDESKAEPPKKSSPLEGFYARHDAVAKKAKK